VEATRIDRWLCASRLCRSRTAAQDACVSGQVRVNGARVKSSQLVTAGDEISVRLRHRQQTVSVREIEVKRQGPERARQLYEVLGVSTTDCEPCPIRIRAPGRPTKRERRVMERFTGAIRTGRG